MVAATRLASAVRAQYGGVIFDVCALRHVGGGRQPFPWDPDGESILHHVALVCRPQRKRRFDAATRGLVKFGRPELEIRRVPESLMCETAELLFQVGEYVARGALVIPGDTVGHPERQLRAILEESTLPLPPFLPVLRLVDAGTLGSPVKGLRAWAGMDAVPGAGPGA